MYETFPRKPLLFTVIAIAALFALLTFVPQPALAVDLEAGSLSVQSSATNTSFSYAQKLALGQSINGKLGPLNSSNQYDTYWYKFKTSKRTSTYSVSIESLDSRMFHVCFYNGLGSSVRWSRPDGYSGASNLIVNAKSTLFMSKAGKGAWYYVSITRGLGGNPAIIGDGYRLKFSEHPNIKAVTGLKVFKAAKKSLTVKWGKQANATKYQVKYKVKGGKWKTVTSAKNSVKLKKLKANTKYQVKVRAYCKSGWDAKAGKKSNWGAWSNVKTMKTKS